MAGKSAKEIMAGKASVVIGADGNPFTTTMSKLEKRFKAFGKTLLKVGATLSAAGAAITAPIVAAAKSFADQGTSLALMSQRTGEAVENFSAMGHAATKTGSSLDGLMSGLTSMESLLLSAQRGEEDAIITLSRLGLSANNLKGQMPTEQLKTFADRIKGIGNVAIKNDLVSKIFGGTDLLPLLEEGSSGIEALTTEAQKLNLVMSGEAAGAAKALKGAYTTLTQTFQGCANAIGEAVAPALTDLLKTASSYVGSATKWIRSNKALVVGLAAVGVALSATGVAVIGLAGAFTMASTIIGAAVAVINFLLTPLGMATAAVFALSAAFVATGYVIATQTEMGKAAVSSFAASFKDLWEYAKEVFASIADAIEMGRLDLAMDVAWKGIKVVWQAGIDFLKSTWSAYMNWYLSETFKGVTESRKIWQASSNMIARPIAWAIAQASGQNPNDVLKTLAEDNERQMQEIDKAGHAVQQAIDSRKKNAAGRSPELQKAMDELSAAQAAVKNAKGEATKSQLKNFTPNMSLNGIGPAHGLVSTGPAAQRGSAAAASTLARVHNRANMRNPMVDEQKKTNEKLDKLIDQKPINVKQVGN